MTHREKGCALVTGASRGIGAAIAHGLAKDGFDLALTCANSIAPLAEFAARLEADYCIRAKGYQGDVSDAQSVEATVEQVMADFTAIDVLVNNAGVASDNLLMRMSEGEFDRVLDVNLKGAFLFMRHVAPGMIRRRTGRIINIASVVGIMGNAGQCNYAAAKAGLIGLTKSAARELASRNITVNAVAPGWIQTDMTGALSEKAAQAWLSKIPLNRAGTPEDVAEVVRFLSGSGAGYLTGQVISVDGGMHM